MIPIFGFIFVVSTLVGAGNAQFSTEAPIDCSFDGLQQCQKISVQAVTASDPATGCLFIELARNCFATFKPCTDISIKRALNNAFNALDEREKAICSPLSSSTTMPTMMTTLPNTCSDAAIFKCYDLESRADGDLDKFCRLLMDAMKCYLPLLKCYNVNYDLYVRANSSIAMIDNRCKASSTTMPTMMTTLPNTCIYEAKFKCDELESRADGLSDLDKVCLLLMDAKKCYLPLLKCYNVNYDLYARANSSIAMIDNRCKDRSKCTYEKYLACSSLLVMNPDDSREEVCRIMKDWLACYDEMGSCDDNPSVKQQVDQYKEAFESSIEQCSLSNKECSWDKFNGCTKPLATMADVTGLDTTRMCYIWQESKLCLNKLDKDCADGDSIKEMIATVIKNVSIHMTFCNEIVGCTDKAMASCMVGLDTASTNNELCYFSEEAKFCIQRLVDYGCTNFQMLQRAKDILEGLDTTNKLACYGDGDGQVPGGAQTTHSMFLVLGAMTLIAMIYN